MENILKEIVTKNKLEQKSLAIFWETFEGYCVEEQKEFEKVFTQFSLEKMDIEVRAISFKLGNWPECNYNHIIVNLPIIYDKHERGYYDVYFNLDGEVEDDYFVIY
ncbi:MAG: hypothetical protein ACRCWY_11950 [Cellulosilyticaceae bacterium]